VITEVKKYTEKEDSNLYECDFCDDGAAGYPDPFDCFPTIYNEVMPWLQEVVAVNQW